MMPAELSPSMHGAGQMLPTPAYCDPDVLSWELEHVFAGGWMCLGRADSFAAAGDRRAYRIGEEGVLVVRGSDGRLRGFYNSCRHRAHELLPDGASASGKLIRCPYHAWVYTADGDLRGVPPTHQDDIDDPSGFSLVPVAVEEWQGYVMANLSGTAAPLAQYLAGIDDYLGPYSMPSLRVGETHSYTLNCNWKLILENYHECFHCSSIHPELCVVSDPEAGSSVFGEGMYFGGTNDLRPGVATMSLDGSIGGARIPGLPDKYTGTTLYLQVGPNLLVSGHPDYVMIHRLVPLAADRTFVECQWLFPDAAFEVTGFDPSYAVDFWDITNRQDWTACESVQRGVASRGYRPGPLSSYHEVGVRLLTRWLARGYATGDLSPQITGLIPREELAGLGFPVDF
jgi:Rieske 2Fe-2S family protein